MAEELSRRDLDLVQLLGEGWRAFRTNAFQYLVGTIIVLAVLRLTSYFYVASLILTGPMMLGLFQMALKGARGKPVALADVLAGFDYFMPSLVANLLIFIFSFIGAFLCLIPGAYILVLSLPTFFFILDEDLGFWDAMERCRALVLQDLTSWLMVATLVICLNLAGMLFALVGAIVTMPLSYIVLSIYYDRTRNSPAADMQEVATP